MKAHKFVRFHKLAETAARPVATNASLTDTCCTTYQSSRHASMRCIVLGMDAHRHPGDMQQVMHSIWHLSPLASAVGNMSVSAPGTHLPCSRLARCEVWLLLSEVSPCCRFLRVSRRDSISKMAIDVRCKAGTNEGQQWRTGSILRALARLEAMHGLAKQRKQQTVHIVLTTGQLLSAHQPADWI